MRANQEDRRAICTRCEDSIGSTRQDIARFDGLLVAATFCDGAARHDVRSENVGQRPARAACKPQAVRRAKRSLGENVERDAGTHGTR